MEEEKYIKEVKMLLKCLMINSNYRNKMEVCEIQSHPYGALVLKLSSQDSKHKLLKFDQDKAQQAGSLFLSFPWKVFTAQKM